ncbi:MAG: thioredoxin fold domain-containing protein [Elusimicrobiota bacterium]
MQKYTRSLVVSVAAVLVVCISYTVTDMIISRSFVPSWVSNTFKQKKVKKKVVPTLVKFMSYKSAMNKTQKINKPVMVDVYTDWCGWCTRLDETTYNDKNVAALCKDKFYSVKVDGETPDGKKFCAAHNIQGFPTIMFIDSKGVEIDRIVGYLPAEVFIRELNKIVDGKKTFSALKELVKQTPEDGEVLCLLGKGYMERENYKDAIGLFEKAGILNYPGKNVEEIESSIISCNLGLKENVKALGLAEKFIVKNPTSTTVIYMYRVCAYIHKNNKDYKKAIPYVEKAFKPPYSFKELSAIYGLMGDKKNQALQKQKFDEFMKTQNALRQQQQQKQQQQPAKKGK